MNEEQLEVMPLEIPKGLGMNELADLLVDVVNYGDYLAEQRKLARNAANDAKRLYKQQRLIGLTNADGRDAEIRKAQADDYCQSELTAFDTADVQADYIRDLFSNNEQKVEAIRSVLSSKKQSMERHTQT